MAERPILFSAPLVRAILAGRKTETRRLITGATSSPRVYSARDLEFSRITHADSSMRTGFDGATEPSPHDYVHVEVREGHDMEGARDRVCPRILPGDTLWVRETWRGLKVLDDLSPSDIPACERVMYEADGLPCNSGAWGKVRQSIFMPRWASRITLRVTDVKAERLHEITDEGALAEGVQRGPSGYDHDSPRAVFRRLWDEINGKRPGASWDSNPWVWVIRFEVADGAGRDGER